MSVSPVTAPAARPATTPPAPDWAPAALDVATRVSPMPDVEARVKLALDFTDLVPGGPAPKPTRADVEVLMSGKVVQQQGTDVPVTADERKAALAVRDALKGTSYLADAKPWVDGLPELNTVRLSWVGPAGERQMVDLPALEPRSGYEALYQSLEAYAKASGLRK